MNILVTCPPMLGMQEEFLPKLKEQGISCHCPEVIQTLSEEELCELVPKFDGWIIGDDPATAQVFEAGYRGRLRAAVKWGIGVDNVDLEACKRLGIPIVNTPGMFGDEVADIAIGYLIGLARETYLIDRQVRARNWLKPIGISIRDKKIGLVGFGDIGQCFAKRAKAMGAKLSVYDPGCNELNEKWGELAKWPDGIGECDFIVFTCSLNKANYHMLGEREIEHAKRGVRIVNVARGGLIDENALCSGLEAGIIHSVALDVFEVEPLAANSRLRAHERCIFGSHNASNTRDAVAKTNERAISELLKALNGHCQ